jgi:hypothetical protein
MGCLLKKRKTISCLFISIQKSCQKTDSIFFPNDWLFLWCPCSFSDDSLFFWRWCQNVLAHNSFLLSPVQAGNIGIYDVTEEQDE